MNIKEPLPERLSRELNQIFALLPSEHRRQEWIQGLQKTILDRSCE